MNSPPADVSADLSRATAPVSTVHALRRRWKPHKLRLQAAEPNHPTTIRFHRACSWLQRAESLPPDDDLKLVSLWIGFNALYGVWDAGSRQPAAEHDAWRTFLDRLLALDRSQHLASALQEHKPLVMETLEDAYLSNYFWEDPGPARAGKARKAMYDARTWYLEGRWALLLDRVTERIYLLRCQLVHGAATHGGQLNRSSVRRCSLLLQHLLTAALDAYIDHGADEDWGGMCYPPLRQ